MVYNISEILTTLQKIFKLKTTKMKNTLIILCLTFAFNLSAQDLKSLSDAKDSVSNSAQSSFIENFAGDQVKKLAKKLNLSDTQQTQVSNLVVSQLNTDKFQKLINSFSPTQLMAGKAQDKIADSLMKDNDFKSGLDNVLSEEQKKILN